MPTVGTGSAKKRHAACQKAELGVPKRRPIGRLKRPETGRLNTGIWGEVKSWFNVPRQKFSLNENV